MIRKGAFSIAVVILFIIISVGLARAEAPSQFIAKMYSEALGRAPDASSWQNYTNYFLVSGCSMNTLSAVTNGFFNSPEYTSKGYTPEEAVLTAYRAVLSREPDSNGFNYFVWLIRSNGWTPAMVANALVRSSEFSTMIGTIC